MHRKRASKEMTERASSPPRSGTMATCTNGWMKLLLGGTANANELTRHKIYVPGGASRPSERDESKVTVEKIGSIRGLFWTHQRCEMCTSSHSSAPRFAPVDAAIGSGLCGEQGVPAEGAGAPI